MRICGVENCSNQTRNRTSPYCEKHYTRFRRHGDASVVLKDHTPAQERWKTSYTVDPETDCWNWTGRGSTRKGGYGLISNGAARSSIPAHVFVYEQVVGPVPDGMELDHTCENKACVNPAHLEPVTGTENQLRAAASRRARPPRDDEEKRRVREAIQKRRAAWRDNPNVCNGCGNPRDSNFFKLCEDCRARKHAEYVRKKARQVT